ncbi:tetraacyldisaccharide 4'-kinase [Vibrio sp.]|uniref:tetraacyldisaccharide 4'-kinase n=1 Tax=Vibrio sp. TaxID=678 RepID=UPI003D14E1D9
MFEKIWFENHPAKYWLGWLLWPLSLLFGRISTHRREAYLSGKKTRYRAPVPIVVVGNITAGGNGKTPVVIWLVEQLLALGYRPGVVSRGYGGKAPGYPLQVNEQTPVNHSGDEPKLIFQRTKVPVAVAPVRSEAVKALLDQHVDVIITDDGLQHYALERDLELVVIDGVRRFGNQQLIPMGPLREPMSRLEQVDLLITNGGKAQPGELPMTLTPQQAVNLVTGEQRPVTQLERLVAFAGIGHPPRFFATLHSLGATLVKTQSFADHQDFNPAELEALAQQGSNVIMTEKDAVKCAQFADNNWWYLPVDATFSEQDSEHILNRIKEVINNHGSPSA